LTENEISGVILTCIWSLLTIEAI